MSLKHVHEETHTGKSNAARVFWWRQHVAKLTVVELAALTGYSAPAIYRLERGFNSLGKPFQSPVWTRYFKALQALAQSRGVKGP